jgi:hypothetical protein
MTSTRPTTISTSKFTTTTAKSSILSMYTECYYNSILFQNGLNMTQAQVESDLYGDGGALVKFNYGPSGYSNYWYNSSTMTGEMCVSSCAKYGFIYAAINS